MPDTGEGQDGCVFPGQYGQVRFARAADGSFMVKPVWDTESKQWQKAFMVRFVAITSEPTLRLVNTEHFKQVEGDLYEFKHNGQQSRIFTFRDGQCWYLVDTFTEKKEDDLPPGVVKRAREKMLEAKSALVRKKGKEQKK